MDFNAWYYYTLLQILLNITGKTRIKAVQCQSVIHTFIFNGRCSGKDTKSDEGIEGGRSPTHRGARRTRLRTRREEWGCIAAQRRSDEASIIFFNGPWYQLFQSFQWRRAGAPSLGAGPGARGARRGGRLGAPRRTSCSISAGVYLCVFITAQHNHV